MTLRRRVAAVLVAVATIAAAACSHPVPVELSTLVVQDSTYLDATTREPFSGPVVRHFMDHPDKVQLEGTLENGVWEGEMTVYHESGRIRYQGALSRGAPCGTWVENQDDEKPKSAFQELNQAINSLGLYPSCPKD